MKIVIFDAHAANPGDLDWTALDALGELEVHPRTPPHLVLERAAGAEALLTNKTLLSAEHVSRLPHLRYIGVLATGYNVVDLPAATAAGVAVTNVPGYSTESVAQHVFALLLEAAAAVGDYNARCRGGEWSASEDFCITGRPITELAGLTFGIVGYGAIGRATARIAAAFGMKVLAASRSALADDGARRVELDELFAASDVVSLHCPLTEATRGLVNAERLARMKPTAVLVNTARGPLLDEAAVAAALASGRLAACAVDVLSTEPPAADNPLLSAPNCIVTPHVAWASRAARRRLIHVAAANLAAYLAGEPVNLVN